MARSWRPCPTWPGWRWPRPAPTSTRPAATRWAAAPWSGLPRWVTTLALSFDHRLVYGELGSRFLADVAALLSDPSRALVWG